MSTVSSCTHLSGGPVVRPANFSGGQLQSGRPAAVALLSSKRRSRVSSVCCANNTKGEHNPKDLHPFNISPIVLVQPGPRQDERWQLKEEVAKVNLRFEVPGQSKEDLTVEIDEDMLVIKKNTSESSKEAVQDGIIYARLLLPAGYSREGVEAELKSGELRISVTKIKEQARSKIKIDIK